MFRRILDERKRDEIDPTLRLLAECAEEAEETKGTGEYARMKLVELHGYFELATDTYERMNKLTTKQVLKAMRMGDKLLSMSGLLNLKRSLCFQARVRPYGYSRSPV